jgi:ribosome-binding factor A
MVRSGAKSPSQRQLRVGEELRHALARVFAHGEFSDPLLGSANITVTEVRVSPDLRNATAFVTPLGGGGLEEAVVALNHAAGYIRSRLAPELRLRYLPRVRFAADRSFDRAERMEGVMARPRVQRDLAATADEADEKDGDHGA